MLPHKSLKSRQNVWLFLLIASNLHLSRAEFSYEAITAVLARISISYVEPVTNYPRSFTAEIGRFASHSIKASRGVLIAALPPPKHPNPGLHIQGCIPNWLTKTPPTPWVALLVRGGCSDIEKVKIAAAQNASAVLLFGNENDAYLQKNPDFEGDIVVVYLLQNKGDQLTALLSRGIKVYLHIGIGQEVKFRITSINRTSILFVSVSFIVLMIVSLAWLVFYYIQRFRYITAKDRLAKHLSNAAKKALGKIPLKTLKSGEKDLEEESCPVCIEPFEPTETLRCLPCSHEFHKNCVDSWLLEHHTCPMCKMDILKYYGFLPNDESSAVEEGSGPTQSMAFSLPPRGNEQTMQVSVITCADTVSTQGDVEITSINPSSDISGSILPLGPEDGLSLASSSTSRNSLLRKSFQNQIISPQNLLESQNYSDSVPDIHNNTVRPSSSMPSTSSHSISADDVPPSSNNEATSIDIESPEQNSKSNEESDSRKASQNEPCEIECIIKEINEIESMDNPEPMGSPESMDHPESVGSPSRQSPPKSHSSRKSSDVSHFESELKTQEEGKKPISPGEASITSGSLDLTQVACDSPVTPIPLTPEEMYQRNSFTGYSRRGSSWQKENGGQKRRVSTPSSHVVTITHS